MEARAAESAKGDRGGDKEARGGIRGEAARGGSGEPGLAGAMWRMSCHHLSGVRAGASRAGQQAARRGGWGTS